MAYKKWMPDRARHDEHSVIEACRTQLSLPESAEGSNRVEQDLECQMGRYKTDSLCWTKLLK
jgi:hypothetical protein